ncbi:hypothetical protein CANTEDRAFT_133104 [Yamadazyma tenuis ATCC 10573]|uniref:PI31 proteasome regulator C-terminal domain-containing protein n=1 Tax=Candida tenuis (strain ATCC 10573 / BCRC 21748 / CBS 615 / JCM 9827 / NBRC 10315 / NRRL Y-1498 / VKM Y-70) TaxID=590646 RepID=G3AXU1_CANTC|nr:uncharacterized protein CANTEDRAFT_133104 [Yamadazyma tenuis ATCC 10573]EGV65696.1 hypothetical protein CANTEDRAFT_133104 [Yamadazyma tenuis ATCC 10573]
MINNFYELTCALTNDYIGRYNRSTFVKKIVQAGDKLTQYFVYSDQSQQHTILIANVVQLTPQKSVVTLCGHKQDEGDKVDSVVVDWSILNPKNSIVLPLDEINLSSEIIALFNSQLDKEVNREYMEALFKRSLRSHEKASISVPASESASESASAVASASVPASAPSTFLSDPPASKNASIPDKPGFDDEYEMQSHRAVLGLPPPGGPPSGGVPSVGDDDLYPGGIKDPSTRGYLDPLRDTSRGSGGMYPSANHPLFNRDRMGGPGNAPFGARYDDPLVGDPDDMDLMGAGLPGFRKPSGGSGGGGFPGQFGNHNPFGGL